MGTAKHPPSPHLLFFFFNSLKSAVCSRSGASANMQEETAAPVLARLFFQLNEM